jgi:hypothetical protein
MASSTARERLRCNGDRDGSATRASAVCREASATPALAVRVGLVSERDL